MFKWIKGFFNEELRIKFDFEKTFKGLKELDRYDIDGAKKTYDLLSELNSSSTKELAEELVAALKKIRYASNTNGVFYFFFPIVSHILYYRPEYENQILGLIIGPNFANGESEVDGMINVIQGAMAFKLNENSKYLTKEGQLWVRDSFPKLRIEIKREIEICHEELNE